MMVILDRETPNGECESTCAGVRTLFEHGIMKCTTSSVPGEVRIIAAITSGADLRWLQDGKSGAILVHVVVDVSLLQSEERWLLCGQCLVGKITVVVGPDVLGAGAEQPSLALSISHTRLSRPGLSSPPPMMGRPAGLHQSKARMENFKNPIRDAAEYRICDL